MAGIEIDIKTTDHQQLYKQGVRAYILQDYDSAVRAFSRCSELLSLEYKDEQHDTLGDVYLYYGKSLLGLSRQELEPLNENIIKNDDDEDDDDADDDNKDGDDGENEEDSGGGGDGTKQNTNEDNVNKSNEGNGTSVNGEDRNTEEKSNDEEKEDELTDLQVAWEVLELAKEIFMKRGDNGKGSLAETLIVLGEVSLESGNFQTGIDDIRNGLDLQKQLYDNDNRTIAETYYKLGTALSTNQQIDESIEQFEKSLESLQLRLDNLKKTNDSEDVKDEIKEIEDLIPEIEEKITDMKSYKLELLRKDENTDDKLATSSSSSSTTTTTTTKPNDISHLVKRKRPVDDDNPTNGNDELPAKKPAL